MRQVSFKELIVLFLSGAIDCPPSNVPTRRSQFEQDGNGLCFTGCVFETTFRSASFLTEENVNSVVLCCEGFEFNPGVISPFSFFLPVLASCS